MCVPGRGDQKYYYTIKYNFSSKVLSLSGWHARKRKQRNVLYNDALDTFYLQLYGVGYQAVKTTIFIDSN